MVAIYMAVTVYKFHVGLHVKISIKRKEKKILESYSFLLDSVGSSRVRFLRKLSTTGSPTAPVNSEPHMTVL